MQSFYWRKKTLIGFRIGITDTVESNTNIKKIRSRTNIYVYSIVVIINSFYKKNFLPRTAGKGDITDFLEFLFLVLLRTSVSQSTKDFANF